MPVNEGNTKRSVAYLLGFTLASAVSLGVVDSHALESADSRPSESADSALSEEFLEYLGEYENVEGEWVDPYAFAESLESMAKLGRAHKTPQQTKQLYEPRQSYPPKNGELNQSEEQTNEKP